MKKYINDELLANLIKSKRKKCGFTQKNLSEHLKQNYEYINPQVISKFENQDYSEKKKYKMYRKILIEWCNNQDFVVNKRKNENIFRTIREDLGLTQTETCNKYNDYYKTTKMKQSYLSQFESNKCRGKKVLELKEKFYTFYKFLIKKSNTKKELQLYFEEEEICNQSKKKLINIDFIMTSPHHIYQYEFITNTNSY